MLNHIVIMGRLVADPELRTTQSQVSVASFRVAVDRDYSGRDGGEKQTDFIPCVAWRSTADFVSKYFSKGSMIVVSGRLQMRQYQDKDGNNRTVAEVNADNVYFGESRRSAGDDRGENRSYGGNYSSYNNSFEAPRASAGAQAPAFSELDDADGQLPF